MSHRTAILTLVAAAVVVGLAVGGCNRNRRRTASAAPAARRAGNTVESSRPAEVMAATAMRPARAEHAYANYIAQRHSQPAAPYAAPVYAARQAPRGVANPAPAQWAATPAPQPAAHYAQARPAAARPIMHPASTTAAPRPATRVYHPTPDLAYAAAMQPAPVAYQAAPAVRAAPIPELSPSRSHRLPAAIQFKRPAAEIMMSSREATPRHEVQRALAPLPQADPTNGWVASPTTAMRTWR